MILKGKNIKVNRGTYNKAKNYFIPEGVDYRVHGENSDTRLLRKAEFPSQDAMMSFIASQGEKQKSLELNNKAFFTEICKENGIKKSDRIEPSFYSAYGGDNRWAFGDDKEANSLSKMEKLLSEGRSTSKVKKAIKKAQSSLNMDGLDSNLNDSFTDCKRKRRYTDDGGDIDIDRAIVGDDRPFIVRKRDGKKRTIRIGVNLMMSHQNGASTYAKIIALAYICSEKLENLGYGVEIMAVQSCGHHQGEVLTSFPLKRVTEPTDIDRVGSVGQPSMSRYFDFRLANILFHTGTGTCNPVSSEMQGFANLDICLGTSWTHGSDSEQKMMITKAISKITETK